MRLRFIFGLLFILNIIVTLSCENEQRKTDNEYHEEINRWHSERIESLKEKDSWLSLAGLYELSEGRQTLGSDSSNDIVFPPQAPEKIGTNTKKEENITAVILPDVEVTHNGESVSEIAMTSGKAGEDVVLKHNNLLWNVIERRGNYYIRLKDTEHPNFTSFDAIERFPVSQKWRIKAIFEAFKEPQPILVPDVLNEGMQDSLHGMLKFSVEGKHYSLAPLGHPQKDRKFFIIFGDKTNGESTYSGGRYLYIPTPENGATYIDFNKAYNPPCVFTPFATCPLPPAQNRLDLEVTAGEKMYKDSGN